MRPGIEKEEILGMLTDMDHSLEETDINLHEYLVEIRETMCLTHSSQLSETGIFLDRMEGKLPQFIKTELQAKSEQSSLKLELSF
ncbi:hypothetical protein LC048_06695 [Mesobacillus subterraneus]|uniref:hypothetical protein n=1 Tax=Mesobacillus subterraneus TaxID=285983 RepID=UPI00273D81F9|nr:hypothetical protein [Mesobacillus subterraneus]WLR56583.1 hypothetical protein LC048_06695 [Mesobacillus subterraneus]